MSKLEDILKVRTNDEEAHRKVFEVIREAIGETKGPCKTLDDSLTRTKLSFERKTRDVGITRLDIEDIRKEIKAIDEAIKAAKTIDEASEVPSPVLAPSSRLGLEDVREADEAADESFYGRIRLLEKKFAELEEEKERKQEAIVEERNKRKREREDLEAEQQAIAIDRNMRLKEEIEKCRQLEEQKMADDFNRRNEEVRPQCVNRILMEKTGLKNGMFWVDDLTCGGCTDLGDGKMDFARCQTGRFCDNLVCRGCADYYASMSECSRFEVTCVHCIGKVWNHNKDVFFKEDRFIGYPEQHQVLRAYFKLHNA